MNILDISEHNIITNEVLSQIKVDGGVILRATWGTNLDDKVYDYISLMVKHGIPYGLYIYSYALNKQGVIDECNFFKKHFHGAELGIYFDMEDADHYKQKNGFAFTRENITGLCDTFMDQMKEFKLIGVYASKSWFDSYISTKCIRWVAHWHSNDGTEHTEPYEFHQYTSNFKIGGKSFDRNRYSLRVTSKPTTINKPDQILTVGSKIMFKDNMIVRAINTVKDWVRVDELGGWISASIFTEQTNHDGKLDNILHVGSRGTIKGVYTVGRVNVASNLVYINELGFWVKAGPCIEI